MSADRLARVVVFTSGPTLRPGISRFICRLEHHAEIDLLAVYCETRGTGLSGIVADAWRRRRLLSIPVLALQAVSRAWEFARRPRRTIEVTRCVRSLGSRLRFVTDMHDAVVIDELRELQADIGLIYGSPILKPSVFEAPRLGTLGIHHGKLPEYRGKKTTFWALYNGEPEAAVAIQKINEGLDTGQIVSEATVTTAGRTLAAVWSELEERGIDIYIDAVLRFAEGRATLRPQTGPRGKLYKDPAAGDIFSYYARRLGRLFRSKSTTDAVTR